MRGRASRPSVCAQLLPFAGRGSSVAVPESAVLQSVGVGGWRLVELVWKQGWMVESVN